ncbi:MAG: type II toxin-antitoxin system RelB/DinJ family antitoxin [Lactimicrobium sp.]|jgi:addiction module RelB/DinJ family antitoxin|uniref:type II toxin-antitoxin system RelB/DinJ family antitoxin n=1 Tax=Lactimicrobium sp. TaxID=2563780 RepID=UPI002F35448F
MTEDHEMTNFTFKIDRKTRAAFNALCDELGLTMSSVVLAMIRQAVRDQRVDFSLRDENGLTRQESDELIRRIQEAKEGKIVSHQLIEDE